MYWIKKENVFTVVIFFFSIQFPQASDLPAALRVAFNVESPAVDLKKMVFNGMNFLVADEAGIQFADKQTELGGPEIPVQITPDKFPVGKTGNGLNERLKQLPQPCKWLTGQRRFRFFLLV